MAYSELVKNLDHVRSFLRDFYVYGFKSRNDYANKSLRSYDDEKRRIESWLGEYMGFRRTTDGKYSFISIDSREVRHNPLFNAWKAKSFTNGDITLHFILFDILALAKSPLSLTEIIKIVDEQYLGCFKSPMVLDESTVRKKLKEYEDEGLVCITKDGKRAVYSLADNKEQYISKDLLDFYSEIAPCGVIGSFLLDKIPSGEDCFAFKHHYITNTIDGEVLCRLFDSMSCESFVEIKNINRNNEEKSPVKVLPLQVFISVQNGRQYLMTWDMKKSRLKAFRLDRIISVKKLEKCVGTEEYRQKLESAKDHMWGVSTHHRLESTQHVEFTVRAGDAEGHVYRRLLREKRCGKVEEIDQNTYKFSAEVFDANELIPWMRTFICRIIDVKIDDKVLEEQFKNDIKEMYDQYGVGGEGDAI